MIVLSDFEVSNADQITLSGDGSQSGSRMHSFTTNEKPKRIDPGTRSTNQTNRCLSNNGSSDSGDEEDLVE